MKKLIKILRNSFCRICGRDCCSIGSGMLINGMCERCYENGGDDE